MKYCQQCGAEISDDSKFCTFCGAKAGESAVESEKAEPEVNDSHFSEEMPDYGQPVTPNKKGKAEKTKPCKSCKSEIPKKAKKCPYCGKKQSHKGLVALLVILIIIILIIIAGVAGSHSSSSNADTSSSNNVNNETTEVPATTDNNTVEETEEAVEDADVQTVYHVGDTVNDGDVEIVYMASGTYTEDNEYLQPAEGYKYIYAKFALKNNGESDSAVSFFDFECYADGYNAEMYYGDDDDDLSATISAGRTAVGCLYFEVPETAQNIEIEYETNYFTEEKITFAFDGDVDSGYVVEKDTSRTEGAYAVGSTADLQGLKINYVSCEDYTSDNMFVEPKEGYHFVSCTFDIENASDDDQSVSSMLFDCYADGLACDGCYIRDDDLSATLSAGRKANGTVTFEVPDDATVIEVEYLNNIWTSDRIVFTVK